MGRRSLKPGWTRVAFGDVVRQVKERVDPTTAGLERYVAGEHMDTDDLRLRRWGTVGDGYLGPAFHARFRPGQVLYGSRRTYLRKVALAEFEGVTANTTFVIETKDPNLLLPALLPFVMQTEAFHEHSIKKSKGSVNPYVNFSDIAAYEFALPPLDEQQRMANVLSHASALSESVESLHAAANCVITCAVAREFAILQEGSVEMVHLGGVCSRGPQTGIYKPETFHGRGTSMVNMGDLFGHDVIDDATAMAMDRLDVDTKELAAYALTSNDLLFGRRSIVLEGAGRCTLVASLREPAVFESSILRVTLDPLGVDSRFMFEWFRSPWGARQIKRIVTFTTVSGIAGSDLSRVLVPLPPLNIQRQVGERLSTLRNAMSSPHNRYLRCKRLFSAIKASVFGKTR